jgi:hypothetical protein
VPGDLTEVTEIATALGMIASDLPAALEARPAALVGVGDDVWARLAERYDAGGHHESFETAFGNGRAFLYAADGLRLRPPVRVEWKGPHHPPGDDVIPADLRIDHVFLVSCKYLSRVLSNPGPSRLFDRLLVGDERSTVNWFLETAPTEFHRLYAAARSHLEAAHLPPRVEDLTRDGQRQLKVGLAARQWPEPLADPWADLCAAVAVASTQRWVRAMPTPRDKLRLLWRLLRITTATYFVLGTDRDAHLRLRIDSAWDWMQAFELVRFDVAPRLAGQAEVGWTAAVRRRADGTDIAVDGHVEVRWSHGRFLGAPEAKVYLDTPHRDVPGYHPLT